MGIEGATGPKKAKRASKNGLKQAPLLWATHHDTRVLGAAHDGREDGAGGVVTGEAGLAHSRTIVNNECLNLLALRSRWEGGNGV